MPKLTIPAVLFTLMLGLHPAEAVTFKLATLAPNGSTWMKEIQAAADNITKQTEGRVKFKYYTGGIMGNAKSVLKKIRINQLHGGAFTAGELAEVYPDIQLYSLPFLFRSYAEVDYVRARMDDLMRKGLEEQGMILLGTSDGGFAYIMSNSPINTIDELSSKKVWLPEGDIIIESVYSILDIAPVPLPIADVYTGLQTGMIDTIGTSAIGAIAFQWHTRLKYISDIPLMYLTGNLVLDKKAFMQLSKNDQEIVQSVMQAAMLKLGKINRDDEQAARRAMQNQGINFVEISKKERQRSEQVAEQAIEKLGDKGVYSIKMYRQLEAHISKYRSQANSSAHVTK